MILFARFATMFSFLILNLSAWDGELTKELKQRSDNFSQKAPPEKKKLYQEATNTLAKNHPFSSIPNTGEKMRDGTIYINQEEKSLASFWQDGWLIITFYRGGWCPYCIIELKAYEKLKSEFESLGATILAISPETEAEIQNTKMKAKIDLIIGSDKNNTLAKKLGLAFTLPENIIASYREFGLDLAKNQGSQGSELPIPATFVIDPSGTVRFMQAEADYTKRADPEEILVMLRLL